MHRHYLEKGPACLGSKFFAPEHSVPAGGDSPCGDPGRFLPERPRPSEHKKPRTGAITVRGRYKMSRLPFFSREFTLYVLFTTHFEPDVGVVRIDTISLHGNMREQGCQPLSHSHSRESGLKGNAIPLLQRRFVDDAAAKKAPRSPSAPCTPWLIQLVLSYSMA